MKEHSVISTKIHEALYKLQAAETMMFRNDFESAMNYIEESKRLIQSHLQEKNAIDK